jgi:hypothetical protein
MRQSKAMQWRVPSNRVKDAAKSVLLDPIEVSGACS